MRNSQRQGIELYENLGKLFYAMAMADGKIHTRELEKLKEIVRQSWLDVDDIEDAYHSDAAYQIETVFDWAMENDLEREESYEDFAAFYQDHQKLFPKPIKALIFSTAKSIADSFSGTNKSELILLGKLNLLFKA